MNDLVQDIWHDLRAKRLWPVALVLLVGIVTIPIVLMQSSEPPPAPPVATEAEPEPDGLEVQLAEIAGGEAGSALDTLGQKNPFKPPAGVMRSGETATATATSSSTVGPSSSDGTSGGGSDPGGSQPDTPAGSPGGGGSPGGSDDGGSTDDGPAPAPAPTPDAPEPPPTTTTSYEYVADITFWHGERRLRIKRLRKLDTLPNRAAPVLIFMGTGPKGGNAVFLVDATLKAAGEGRCVPGPANCAFVHIGPGSEHAFTTEDGDSYRLRIDQIRRVRVRDRRATPRRHPGASASDTASRRFALPSLVDLVEVTGPGRASGAGDDKPSSDRTRSR